MNTEIAILILQILIFLFGGLLAAYFKKKGENLATIEDTQKITTELEKVKLQYSKLLETEKTLKSLLAERMSTYNKKKDSLLFDLYDDGNTLFEEMINIHVDDTDIKNIKNVKFEEYIMGLNIKLAKYEMSFDMANSFYDEKSLIDSIEEFSKPIYELMLRLQNISTEINNRLSNMHYNSEKQNKVEDIEKANDLLNYQYKTFLDYIEYAYNQREIFHEARKVFTSELIKYFENIENQIDVR